MALTALQIRRLNILVSAIPTCNRCSLRKNGMAIPYFSERSRFLMLAEAPGFEEIQEDQKTPLVGKAGRTLFSHLKNFGFAREDFLIINTVQCRPVTSSGKNGKPSYEEIEACRYWTSRIWQVFKPKLVLAFGNYACYYFWQEESGILSKSGEIRTFKKSIVIPCIHPASILYNPINKSVFKRSLKVFSKVVEKKGF